MTKPIKYLIIILSTLVLSWVISRIYHMAFDVSVKPVFSYYSSVDKAFCISIKNDKTGETIRYNVKTGKHYSEAEFDSILPMFQYRQLMWEGKLPDSIRGQAISAQEFSNKKFFYRYKPRDKDSPQIPIYRLFESNSGRVQLEYPGDYFTLKDKIKFINPQTNKIIQGKTNLFMSAFVKAGFEFPATIVSGNQTGRKPYDEGYFIKDANGDVWHLKMIKGLPYLKNINLTENIHPIYIAMVEPLDRSIYAFIFDNKNKLYVISTDNYKVQLVKTPSFNPNKDVLSIMANQLYWNVNVISNKGKKVYALEAETKTLVDSISIPFEPIHEDILTYFVPFELSLKSSYTDYIKPTFTWTNSIWVLYFNLFFACFYLVIARIKNYKIDQVYLIWILVTGFLGFIPCVVMSSDTED